MGVLFDLLKYFESNADDKIQTVDLEEWLKKQPYYNNTEPEHDKDIPKSLTLDSE
jgi:hypothetical protein